MIHARVAGVMWLAIVLGNPALAANPADPESPPVETSDEQELRFRRVYVPADRINDWPRGGVQYLPMDRAEFERRIKAIDAQKQGPKHAAGRIERAEYFARLFGDTLVDGTATLVVQKQKEGAILLSLAPCGLAIDRPRWVSESGDATPARMGLGADGKPVVLVERSGTLAFDWSLSPRRDTRSRRVFDFSVPSSPATKVLVELPTGVRPVVESAIVDLLPVSAKVGSGADGADADAAGKNRKWQISVGGRSQFTVSMMSPEHTDTARVAIATQNLRYELSPRGLLLACRMTLDVFHEPLRSLKVDLEGDLQLATARFGNTKLHWDVTKSDGDRKTAVVSFPEPILGSEQTVSLEAFAPLVLGKRWTLPMLRPRNVFWQEGQAQIAISGPLSLDQLIPVQGQQTSAASGGPVNVRLFTPEAAIDVMLTEREPLWLADSGTVVAIGPDDVQAQILVRLTSTNGRPRRFTAPVVAPWSIERVETTGGADLIDDWIVQRGDDGGNTLTVTLKNASGVAPPSLLIAARRTSVASGGNMRLAMLAPLRFPAGRSGRRLLSLRAQGSHVLRVSGDELAESLDARSLTPGDAALFADPPSGPILVMDPAAESVTASIEARPVNAKCDARVEATVEDGMVQESYHFSLEPDGERIRSVLLVFSEARKQELHWSVTANRAPTPQARRLSDAELNRLRDGPFAEAWEVDLRVSRTEPFVLRAARASPLSEVRAVALAACPQMATQTGSVAVLAAGARRPVVLADSLIAAAATKKADGEQKSIGNEFRFDPVRDVRLARGAAVQLLPAVGDAQPLAWAYHGVVRTRFANDGTAHHQAVYYIENAGRDKVRVDLPADASEIRVFRDGVVKPSANRMDGDNDASVTIDLPQNKRHVILCIEFATVETRLGVYASRRPPPISLDIPVLSAHWQCWAPPDCGLFAGSSQDASPVPLSWTKRLFGVFAREHVAPFDPFSPESWQGLADGSVDAAAEQQMAQDVVDRLGARLAGANDRPAIETTWAKLLGGFGEQLYVDSIALARVGIFPQLPLTHTARGPQPRQVSMWLDQSGLRLVATPAGVWLTTAGDASLFATQLEPLAILPRLSPTQSFVYRIHDGPLARQFARAMADDESVRCVRADQWAVAEVLPSPWASDERTDNDWALAIGWQVLDCELSPQSEISVVIVDNARVQALRWIVVLFIALLVWWKLAARSILLLSLVGVVGVIALILPDSLAPLIEMCSSVLLGCALGVGLRVVFAHRDDRTGGAEEIVPSNPRGAPATATAATGAAATLILVSWLAVAGYAAEGDAGAATKPSTEATVHRVLIPIDDAQRVVGEKVYVPAAMYRQLIELEARDGEPRGWLLASSNYRASLGWNGDGPGMVVAELTATIEIDVLTAPATVRLPFSQAKTQLASIRINGRIVGRDEYAFATDGEVLEIRTRSPGSYRLELSLQPPIREQATTAGFEMAIPPLPSARLDLQLPADAPEMQLPMSYGQLSRDAEQSRVTASLGPVESLAVRWPRSARRGGEAPGVEIDELLWLDVRPGAVVLQARWKCKPVSGPVEQIRLAADPRLAMLPLRKGSPIESAHRSDNQPDVLVLKLARPMRDETVLEAKFLLQGTYGLGNVRLPRLEALGASAGRRLLAVSVDPAFDYEPRIEGEIAPATVADFMGDWGAGAEALPVLAYQLSPGDVGWSLATRRRQSRVRVDQIVTLAFHLESVELRCEASLTSDSESGYQYQVQFQHLPPDARPEVRQVSIIDDGEELVSHWAWTNASTLVVHLKKRPSVTQRAAITLRVSTAAAGVFQLPIVQLDGARTATNRYRILRRDGVLVQMRGGNDVAIEQGPTADAATSSTGKTDATKAPLQRTTEPPERIVRELLVTGPSPDARFAFRPNRPRIEATFATVLEPATSSKWIARIEGQVSVRDGVLDELRIDVPDSWSEPIEVQPAATWRMVPAGTSGVRQLFLRPLTPIQREQKFTIRGYWSQAPDAAAPIVAMRGATTLRRFIVLPAEHAGRQLTWEHRSLNHSGRDELERRLRLTGLIGEVFEATNEASQARLLAMNPAASRALVSIAEIRVALNRHGDYHGVATFAFPSVGRRHCDIELPEPLSLVHMQSADGQSLAYRTAARTWRLPLAAEPNELVEILFQGSLGDSSDQLPRIVVPKMVGVTVEHTRWRIHSPAKMALLRLGSDSTTQDVHHRAWQVDASKKSAPPDAARPIGEFLGHFAESLDPVRTLQSDDAINQLDVTGRLAPPMIRPGQLLAAFLWIAAFALLAALARRPDFRQAIASSPQTLLVLAGLAWWLLLAPSALGLLLALVASAAPLLPVWRIKRAKRPQHIRLPAKVLREATA